MNPNAENNGEDAARGRLRSDLILLGGIAPLAGLGAGLVGALFRLALEEANRIRDVLMARMDVWGVVGFMLFVGLAAGAAAIAAWLVRCIAPSAAGSGIPRVIAVLNEEAPPAPLRVIPVKFFAGTLAIGTLLGTLTVLEAAATRHPGHSLFGGRILPDWPAPPPPWIVDWVPQDVVYAATKPPLAAGPIDAHLIFSPNFAARAELYAHS